MAFGISTLRVLWVSHTGHRPARNILEMMNDAALLFTSIYCDPSLRDMAVLGTALCAYTIIRNFWMCFLLQKSGVLEATAESCLRYSNFDFIQADVDGVFISGDFQRLCRDKDKQRRYTTPHSHEFHPVERYNRT